MAGTLPNFNKTDPWSIAGEFIKDQNREIANQDYRTHQLNILTGKNMRDTAESDQKPLRRYREQSAVNQANLENAEEAERLGLGGGSRYRSGSKAYDPEVFNEFMEGVKEKGITNPYALAVIAGTGQVESGFSKGNMHRTWSDPSQSGKAGTSGLIMSWRADRLKNALNYGRERGENMPSARTQGNFLVDENPEMAKALQNAGSLAEAQKIINNNWKFAGYDTGGGSSKARFDASANFLKQFGANPMTAKERTIASNDLNKPTGGPAPLYDDAGREYFELNMDADGFKKIQSGMPGARQKIVIDESKPIGPRGQVVVRQYTGKEDKSKIPQSIMQPQPSIVPAPKTAEVKKPMGYDGSEDM